MSQVSSISSVNAAAVERSATPEKRKRQPEPEHRATQPKENYDSGVTKVTYLVDEKKKEVIVQVLDDKGKVIKEIPPEELRKASDRIEACIGKLLDMMG